jgi:hypothetical protein
MERSALRSQIRAASALDAAIPPPEGGTPWPDVPKRTRETWSIDPIGLLVA